MKDIKRKHILYIITATLIVYGIVHYFDPAVDFLAKIGSAVMPFAAGAVMAYIVNILMETYEKILLRYIRNMRGIRLISVVLAILTFIAVIILLLGIIIPQLVKSVSSLMNINPEYINRIILSAEQNELISCVLYNMKIDINNIDIANYVTKSIQNVMSSVGGILSSVIEGVSEIFGTIVSLFMAAIFAVYILFDKEKLCRQGDMLLIAFVPKYRDRILFILNIFNVNFRNYFISQVKEAAILGALIYIMMLTARLPYAASISMLVGVTALIPVVGAYIGLFIGAVMILTVSFRSMIIFIIFHTLVQQFENNVIYPRVVGSSVGLPGMWVIVAVSVGGVLGGIVGILAAVPTAASLYYILKIETNKRLEQD